jgi:hypothetical protein
MYLERKLYVKKCEIRPQIYKFMPTKRLSMHRINFLNRFLTKFIDDEMDDMALLSTNTHN